MRPQSYQKIYLNQEYPCPCHINGKLQQIVLTEAFGCERCRRIFVVQEDHCTIEELATQYPYKRRYGWTGSRWRACRAFRDRPWWALVHTQDSWALWLQGFGLITILLAILRPYYRLITASPILNLVSSMAIAIFVFIVITIWLFSQG